MPLLLAAHDIPTKNLQRLFDFCNDRYFANALVPSPGFKLQFNRSQNLFGSFNYCLSSHTDWSITLSRRLQDHPFALLSTMVHEMVHMLAHQYYRESGDPLYLDETALPGQPFFNVGHGAFFLAEADRLNQRFPELKIQVKSNFGDELYDHDKIADERLLLVTIDAFASRGMIYRLHPQADNDWQSLRALAEERHGSDDIQVLLVPGALADGFPQLRRDNRARRNSRILSLRNFTETAAMLGAAEGSRCLFASNAADSDRSPAPTTPLRQPVA